MPKLYLAICFGLAVVGVLAAARYVTVRPLGDRAAERTAASALVVPFELTPAEQALRVRESRQ